MFILIITGILFIVYIMILLLFFFILRRILKKYVAIKFPENNSFNRYKYTASGDFGIMIYPVEITEAESDETLIFLKSKYNRLLRFFQYYLIIGTLIFLLGGIIIKYAY